MVKSPDAEPKLSARSRKDTRRIVLSLVFILKKNKKGEEVDY